MSISISLVVNTLNEEHNIADCICSAQELDIRYSGWQGNSHYRFFKKGSLEFPHQEVHANPKILGRQLILNGKKGKIQHFNLQDLRHFIKIINDYTDGEALKLLRGNGKITPLRSVYWGLRHFCKRYLKM